MMPGVEKGSSERSPHETLSPLLAVTAPSVLLLVLSLVGGAPAGAANCIGTSGPYDTICTNNKTSSTLRAVLIKRMR